MRRIFRLLSWFVALFLTWSVTMSRATGTLRLVVLVVSPTAKGWDV